LLFIIFKKNFCGNRKEIYKSPNSSGNSPNDLIIPSGAFTRGICLDTTTVSVTKDPFFKPISDVWNKIKTWPLTNSLIGPVRTYSFGVDEDWIKYLLSNNVEVFIGISNADTKTDSTTNIPGITKMCNTLKSWPPSMLTKIIAFSVANEPTTNRNPKDKNGKPLVTVTKDYNDMKSFANQLRTCLKSVYTNGLKPPPITACFVTNTFGTITEYLSLFKSNVLDPLVCSNIYSELFSDKTNSDTSGTETELEKAVSWSKGNIIVGQINDSYSLIKNNNLNAKLWITEIGWTSAPLASFAHGKGWASIDLEKKMYQNFLNASTDQGIVWPERVFWFTIRDTNNPTKKESFGIFNENFNSKFGDSPPPPPSGSSCNASGSISNGTIGNCTSTLVDGATCYPICNSGYTLSGNRTCSNSKVTDTAKCNLITPSGYGTNEYPFKNGCAKGAYCNNGGTLCFNKDVNDFYCQPNCSNTTKPDCVKYPPPQECKPFCSQPSPPTPSGDGYKDGEDIFQQNCSKGTKCANPNSTICFNPTLKNFSCEPSCSNSIKPDCVHNPPKDLTCKSLFCPTPSDGYKDGEDIFQQNCSKGTKCANPSSKICFNPTLKNFSCKPSCSNSIKPDCVHNPPKDPTCKSVFCS
jgi:hypothetical protein